MRFVVELSDGVTSKVGLSGPVGAGGGANSIAQPLTQVKDQTVQLKPLRAGADDSEVVVRTEVKGKGDPIQLDYRLEKTPAGWKIYDVNVLGVWLADTSFKSQFAPIIANSGLDGLIGNLVELNRKAAARN